MERNAEKKSKQSNTEGLWYRGRYEVANKLFGKRVADAIDELPELSITIDNPFTGVYFCGGVSTGKTTYAARLTMSLYKEWFLENEKLAVEKQETFKIVHLLVDEIPIHVQSAIERKEYAKMMSDFFTADIVVLDDVFSKPSEIVNAIIKARYAHGRTTILTSNFELKDLTKSVDSSILRRIEQSCKLIKCTKIYGKTNNNWSYLE